MFEKDRLSAKFKRRLRKDSRLESETCMTDITNSTLDQSTNSFTSTTRILPLPKSRLSPQREVKQLFKDFKDEHEDFTYTDIDETVMKLAVQGLYSTTNPHQSMEDIDSLETYEL